MRRLIWGDQGMCWPDWKPDRSEIFADAKKRLAWLAPCVAISNLQIWNRSLPAALLDRFHGEIPAARSRCDFRRREITRLVPGSIPPAPGLGAAPVRILPCRTTVATRTRTCGAFQRTASSNSVSNLARAAPRFRASDWPGLYRFPEKGRPAYGCAFHYCEAADNRQDPIWGHPCPLGYYGLTPHGKLSKTAPRPSLYSSLRASKALDRRSSQPVLWLLLLLDKTEPPQSPSHSAVRFSRARKRLKLHGYHKNV